MSKTRRPNQSNRPSQGEMSPEVLKKFFSNQSKELENRSKELDLVKYDKQQSYNYANRALEVQSEDRKEERQQKNKLIDYGFWIVILLILLFAGFIGGCFYTGNVNLIISILEISAYVIPSVVGGYFYGLNKGKKASMDQNVEFIDD